MNLAHLLIEGLKRHGDHPAIHCRDQTITYKQLNHRVDCLAHGLDRLGVRPGSISILMMPNSIDWVIIYYALAKIGAVVLPVNFLYRKGELEHIFKDSGARVFIGHADYLEHPKMVMDSLAEIKLRIAQGVTKQDDFIPLTDVFSDDGETLPFPIYPVKDDDLWAIIYTSGTTGLPKGAMLSHHNLVSNAMTVADMRVTYPNEVVLGVIPLYHIYGQTSMLNSALYLGLTIRLWPQFDEQELFAAIETEESCILFAVPTILNRLLGLADIHEPKRSGLRFCICGAASLPAEVLYRFQDSFETTIYEGYGLTETSPVCTENPYGKPTRPGSIGLPIPGFESRIVDDRGKEAPVGEIGEHIVRGPGVMIGYINNPEATAQTIRNGWLHTGDLARMDEDGYIYILDRKKEMIIRGGYNVYPREIEEILCAHPAVAEAAVIGMPHADLGEEVAAAVVLRFGERATVEELREFVKARVAPYKYPRIIHLTDELPKSHTGKILKRAIELKDCL